LDIRIEKKKRSTTHKEPAIAAEQRKRDRDRGEVARIKK